MYTFIRKDIDEAYKIIQAGHALFEHALTIPAEEKPKLTSSFCLLEAQNEDELRQIAGQLEQEGIKFTAFYEPDYNTGYTAITAGPIYGDDRKKFKKYKFFRGAK